MTINAQAAKLSNCEYKNIFSILQHSFVSGVSNHVITAHTHSECSTFEYIFTHIGEDCTTLLSI